MPEDLDFLRAVSGHRRPGPDCSIRIILERMEQTDPSLAAQVRTALGDRLTYAASAMAQELRRRGYSISEATIARHRRNVCACSKES